MVDINDIRRPLSTDSRSGHRGSGQRASRARYSAERIAVASSAGLAIGGFAPPVSRAEILANGGKLVARFRKPACYGPKEALRFRITLLSYPASSPPSPIYAWRKYNLVALIDVLTFWLQSCVAGIGDRCRCGGAWRVGIG